VLEAIFQPGTGRWKRSARNGMSTSSGYTISLAPKPPPTSGAITRTRWGSNPSRSQMNWRTWCGTWVASTFTIPRVGVRAANDRSV